MTCLQSGYNSNVVINGTSSTDAHASKKSGPSVPRPRIQVPLPPVGAATAAGGGSAEADALRHANGAPPRHPQLVAARVAECSVVAHNHHPSFVRLYCFGEGSDTSDVEVVGGLVEQQHLGVSPSDVSKRHPHPLPSGEGPEGRHGGGARDPELAKAGTSLELRDLKLVTEVLRCCLVPVLCEPLRVVLPHRGNPQTGGGADHPLSFDGLEFAPQQA
eukprot:CAMPEP_0114172312 /NCGR_PEP_ID=MMETSP0043_2-20121206/35199_1 /TAXON_ID=464988 /ORGANISM="Hemiselmis andersenii, Strain CCMP644" /LENGTH=216 /DNA_ID=CAMNT_0001270161 /DNA_START=63 /DNA_END=714 /DNA_ORIENTATION=+